ncbi:hypothetical protein AN219_27330 [Streptomyces nanshensis]|nr:hypothetical protein AN219_27330 [Streptomyces nanshensis]
MTNTLCSPVGRAPEVIESGLRARTEVTVPPDEKVFPGHYPGFPIYPGVCIVECVHRSALATVPGSADEWEMHAVEATRFVAPVFPGDALSIGIDWSQRDGAWRCKALVSSDRGEVAPVRLRFGPRRPR